MGSSINYFIYFHSITRYFIILFAVIVVVQCLVGMLGHKKFTKGNRMPALMLLIFCDIQLLLGFLLYYNFAIASGLIHSANMMKDTYSRFFAVEHAVSMIIAIVLVHVGYSTIKKAIDDDRKFKRLFWCIFIALVLIMAMTPWEGKEVVGKPNFPAMPS